MFFCLTSILSFAGEFVEKVAPPVVECANTMQVLLSCGTQYEQCTDNKTMEQIINSVLQAEQDYCG